MNEAYLSMVCKKWYDGFEISLSRAENNQFALYFGKHAVEKPYPTVLRNNVRGRVNEHRYGISVIQHRVPLLKQFISFVEYFIYALDSLYALTELTT